MVSEYTLLDQSYMAQRLMSRLSLRSKGVLMLKVCAHNIGEINGQDSSSGQFTCLFAIRLFFGAVFLLFLIEINRIRKRRLGLRGGEYIFHIMPFVVFPLKPFIGTVGNVRGFFILR